MLRIIFWAALIFGAVWYYKRWKRREALRNQRPAQELPASPMVRCAHCGVHLPQDRALGQGSQWYCSQEHQLQGPAGRGH